MDIKPVVQKDQDAENGHGGTGFHMSKITMQMTVIGRAITIGLKFPIALFDSRYFAAKLTNFLESLGKDWISETKSDRKILVDGKWIGIGDYEESLN